MASIISRGSIRPDECAVGGPLYERAPHGVPYERSQMETRRESGTGPVRLAIGHIDQSNQNRDEADWKIRKHEEHRLSTGSFQKKHYIRHPMRALFSECARHTRWYTH